MTDDEILGGWRQGRQNCAAAIERFDRGAHQRARRARYGEGTER